MKHATGSALKAKVRVQHPGLSTRFARESAGRFGKMAERFSRPLDALKRCLQITSQT